MAVVTMVVNTKMRDKMLDNWKSKINYAVILTQDIGEITSEVGDWEELSFERSLTPGGVKITHEELGGTDLEVLSGKNVLEFRITRDNSDQYHHPHASRNIGEEYEYGGVFRINKIEITLT